jgi:hypothetical protein
MTPKQPDLSLSPTSRIACYGTAFLADDPVDTATLQRGIAPDVPQFGSPRLDASFLANCGSFLNGKTATMDAPSAYFKRIAGVDFRLPKSTVFYECSTELRALLAALTKERAAEIATEWYGVKGPPKAKIRGTQWTRKAAPGNPEESRCSCETRQGPPDHPHAACGISKAALVFFVWPGRSGDTTPSVANRTSRPRSLRCPAPLADRPLLPCSGARHSVARPCAVVRPV